jgi:CubicO group peptidase (beta-lactamase class C family)
MRNRFLTAWIGLTTSAALNAMASAQVRAPNFDSLTLLARGALTGTSTLQPVAGFDLRLLHNGAPVYHQSFGNWSLNRPANADSSTKTLTGALLMSAIENSATPITLDTTLASLVPSFDATGKRTITLRQAFSHCSGLPGSESLGALADPSITLQQSAAAIAALPMINTPPGSKFSYGGVSMQAAGAAVENATGVAYTSLMAQRLTGPLGMTSTRFVLASNSNPRIGGGIESTATDFGRFMEALRRGGELDGVRVLSSASVQTMFTRQTLPTITLVSSPFAGATAYESTDYGVGTWIIRRNATTSAVEVVLAAGARGFHSWIDLPLGVTGVLATDLSSSSNLVPLTTQMNQQLQSILANPRIAGDTNLDDAVNFTDLLALAQNYNGWARLWSQGDFTGDGLCNFNDLLLLAKNYSSTGGSFSADWSMALASVPEPAAMLGVSALAPLVLRRRR